MSAVPVLSKRNWNLTTAIISLVLVSYIAFLLVTNYFAQVKLRETALEQLQHDAEKRATAVSYFYSERKSDLRGLASNRAISAFFENRALGMSMKYGLNASLTGISNAFERLIAGKLLNNDRIYQRIVLIDVDGHVLVECNAPGPRPSAGNWDRESSPESPEPTILVRSAGEEVEVMLSAPYFFKGSYNGRIVAWVSPEIVYEHLVSAAKSPSSKRFTCLVGAEDSHLLLPAKASRDLPFSVIPDFGKCEPGEICTFDLGFGGKGQEQVVGSSVPVKGAPFSLVTLAPAAEVLGSESLWKLPTAMGVLALLVLGGFAVAWSVHMRYLVLRARLEEAGKVKLEVEEKNEALKLEIIERKRFEEALRESEERYRQLADLLPQPVFEIDGDNLLTFVNRAAFKAFGYSQEDFSRGLSVPQLFAPEDREKVLQSFHLKSEGDEIGNLELMAKRKNGNTFPALIYANPIVRGDLVTGMRGIIMDISERKRMEAELLRTQKLKSIGVLAGGIAHDFNNILTAIIGYTELAMRRIAGDRDIGGHLDQVLQASLRAKDLIKQILVFSRKGKNEPMPVEVRSVVEEALKLIRASLPTTIEIKQDIQSTKSIVCADPTQIHQVLMNLCTNAAHAMSGQMGVLEVTLHREERSPDSRDDLSELPGGSYVKLTVRDNGVGMRPEIQERIFEPYFTTKAKGVGTGLGLAVVHGIVKSLGGSIEVESEEGRGSAFHVFLPLAVKPAKPGVEQSISISWGKECILLVDDEQVIVDIGREALQYLGYQVAGSTSSIEALNAFRNQPHAFDLVITDMTMPSMTGEELAKELIRIRPDIPIILCTGYNELITEKKAKTLGIKEFLPKPWVIQDLTKAIRRALDQN
jgi:PAS domain S-box-containing protein